MLSPLTQSARGDVNSALSGDAAICVKDLTKYFGLVAAVKDVAFEVAHGETVVLWGANGAGKTTVVRCLLGVVPYLGTITVCGADVRSQGKQARRQIGYVPQEIRLHETQTVRETAEFYAALRGLRAVDDRLAEWGLADVATRRVGQLSGGMKQRLALALALLADPPVLLLDEPTSNLDVEARRELLGFLEQFKCRGKTLLLCSHQSAEVWRLADRVIVLESGRVAQQGWPEAVADRVLEETWLGLTVVAERRADALALLQRQGFAVSSNGRPGRLWIRVVGSRKAEPFRVLSGANIAVLDFELSSSAKR